MPNNDLEGRIGVIADIPIFQNIKTFLTDTPGLSRQFNPSNIEHVLTLDKATLDAYKVIIVGKTYLNSEVLADNYKTPILLYQNEDTTNQDDIINYNLFKVANKGTIFEDTRAAIAAHRTVQEFLERNLSGKKILENMVPPKFRNTLRIIEDDKKSRERLQQRIQVMPLKDALWEAVVEDMQKVERGEKPEPLAHNIVDFLVRYPQFEREESIRKMGDNESGEDTVLTTDPQKQSGYMKDASKRFTILRVIEPRIVQGELYTAKAIANQIFSDSRWCYSTKEKRETFRTPYVLAPFHFEDLSQEEKERLKKEFPDFDTNRSILIFEETPGHRFYKSLITLKQGIKDSEKKVIELREDLRKADRRTEQGKNLEEQVKDEISRRKKIYTVGRSFIEKSLKDSAYWTKCETEMLVKNKPSPNELVDFYIKQIDKTPGAIRERSTIEISAEEEVFFKNAAELLYVMVPHIKKEHIVRNRDSWVGNAVLRDIPINFSIDQYIKRFMNGQKPDDAEISSVFENIDMQYRWGHVLEDWAQLVAAYESNFLLQFNEGHKTFESDNILELRNNFLIDAGGNALLNELKDENTVTYPILLYRAVRKMYLFTNYWDNTCHALTTDKRIQAKLKPRRERFTENIEHYALFGKLICKKIATELSHSWNRQNPEKVEHEFITELKGDYYNGDKTFGEDIAKKCNDILSSQNFTNEGKNIVRAYGLASFLEKIYGGFRKREYLKTLYQKGDKDGQS